MEQVYYLDPIYETYRIKVCRYSEGMFFRASTNEESTYKKFLDKLEYRRTFEEAQKDLNHLAKRQGWKLDKRK